MTLNINDYTYALPPERIATYPLEKRDQSKLLVYDRGTIRHETFPSIAALLPDNAMLFFNNTKVIPARLHFHKDTGAIIEVFLLHPVLPSSLVMEAMQAHGTCTWKCTIGNVKRWRDDQPLSNTFQGVALEATLRNREEGLVEFHWTTDHSFAEVVSLAGETPLPPYLHRKPEQNDRERYQTIYSQHDGAVAAPTAGLHFTPEVFDALKQRNIPHDFVTLHVSAGTFQPVKVENAAEHLMHNEQVVIHRENIANLLAGKYIVPVGTTSMRTLESLYWFGVKLLANREAPFSITQHDPYTHAGNLPARHEALQAVARHMDDRDLDVLTGETSIYIMPGYTFRVCDALITNFHQPGSTLILLVAAFLGEDWRTVYDEALRGDYRFLSYGDSSFLIPR
ncbi:S-adenosylmethionine:tRNA ribosyltransferase-isomerase [Chryseolinea lacunae]|uniref:S-adenosylmethionine:tRNA ribosyltransferase-isomerase n=1 Tax=Chryseolinea lacunae TaxID=2801331 RepID=A0ABS1KZR4_9BACT|nr:S-adenosylmethionine:tRNA ribosyltransferase-isomerase [Chryseolinea lacunae]MBL0744955.1 S-adenosylmethionine:tRNA ribosyltransferase-isomerase [Chryseolinea lacunae]